MNEWVWSNGGMILTGENWSTGRKTYSVGGRWMSEYGAMVEWYYQQKTNGMGEEPLQVSLFSTNSTLNAKQQTRPSKVRGQQPIAWAMAQPRTAPTVYQHNKLPLHVCGSNWPGTHKSPVTDPPPALYHFTVYQHTIPSSWKRRRYFLSKMWGSTHNHTSCQKSDNFYMSQSSQYHLDLLRGQCGLKFWDWQSWQWILMVLPTPPKWPLELYCKYGNHCFLPNAF